MPSVKGTKGSRFLMWMPESPIVSWQLLIIMETEVYSSSTNQGDFPVSEPFLENLKNMLETCFQQVTWGF